jgi:DNA topoisomerase-1
MDVVIVESPAKARTINKYLGREYVVLPTLGHVRDLPAKDGSVRPEDDFAMLYESAPKAAKHLKAIADALKGARRLYLATDPDREGEAISWHVYESLLKRRALEDIEVSRVVFPEITRRAIADAMRQPRPLDLNLVNAQQARRALDYLVGFTLSPVLWRKLPGARSAGRVQSVALRLICERETEIEAFKPQEYWSIAAEFADPSGQIFLAQLVELDGKKLGKFDLGNAGAAERAAARIKDARFRVADRTVRPLSRHPAPPFTTSTLQQEASRKLGFSASRTMQIAQRLYEGVDIGGETTGLITYMRTDGVQMAIEAIGAARVVIKDDYGDEFLPAGPRVYKAKTHMAQEAHEAIRPTDFSGRPADLAPFLDEGQRKLYALIWTRAVASQMASAELERTSIDIRDEEGRIGLRASGTVTRFAGFLKIYEEGRDDEATGEGQGKLPDIALGAQLAPRKTVSEQHFTEPPPRYSEASLVKKLEELGIGRPSTYAQIISVLQERRYVRLERNRFIPEDKGRLVIAFLTNFFEHYFAYDFTANLEEQLDDITENRVDWKDVLRRFWLGFSAPRAKAKPPEALVSVRQAVDNLDHSIGKRDVVLKAINEALAPHFFAPRADGKDPRACPVCGTGRLAIRAAKIGAFIGCSNYPDCRYTRPLSVNGEAEGTALLEGPRLLGRDRLSNEPITVRRGPFGLYLQLGETKDDKKPKRVSLPKDIPLDTLDLALALKLLGLPREVGQHPETGKPVLAGLGRFGPYLHHASRYRRLPSTRDVLEIGLNHAVELLATAPAKGRTRALRELGTHPEDGLPVVVMAGRYGPYVRHGGLNATLPKDMPPEAVTLDNALALLAERKSRKKQKPAKSPKAGIKAEPEQKQKPANTANRRGKRARKLTNALTK